MKKLTLIFLLSFVLNFLWENAHAVLYASYQGGAITEFILARAALADAIILTLFALPFIYLPYFRNRKWLIIPAGIVLAVLIELYALQTSRWIYAAAMPLIPFLNVGLTPVLQLGFIGYAVLIMAV